MAIMVKELISKEACETLKFECLAGEEGLTGALTSMRIQKPGLLLTGLLEELHPDRVQIFGGAEIGYLLSLEGEKLRSALDIIEGSDMPALVITRGLDVPDFLKELANRIKIPLLWTPLTSSVLVDELTKFLEERLAPTTIVHGVLMDVLGVGILVSGASGIGKSECGLELVSRGYRLVADDAVMVKRMHPSTLFGMASDVVRYHMEVRGLGIVNVKDIFGITAIRKKKQMDLVVELVEWEAQQSYDRLGMDETSHEILGVKLPHLRVPVSPGRSIATIVEVAARNQIMKIMGFDPAREFERLHNEALDASSKGSK